MFYYFILANADRDEIEAFLDEIHMLKRVGIHRNIVTMLGIQNFQNFSIKIFQNFFKIFKIFFEISQNFDFQNFQNFFIEKSSNFKIFSKFFLILKFFYRNIVTMLGIKNVFAFHSKKFFKLSNFNLFLPFLIFFYYLKFILACCTLRQPYCMVMEYVPHGDLLRYLRNLRKEVNNIRL